jgi:nucleotide-binding universal stress UspA family protein
MYKTIMVPYVDWRFDSKALNTAVQLARRSAARLHLVHVKQGKIGARARHAEEEAFNAAVDWAGDALNESVSFRIVTATLAGLRASRVADAIAKYAKDNRVDLVVIARRKHSAERLLFGSVGVQLIDLLDRSILFVPARVQKIRMNHPRILAPLDGTAAAERLLPEVATLATLTGGSVTALRVVPPALSPAAAYHHDAATEDAVARALHAQRYLDAAAQRLRSMGALVETKIVYGEPLCTVLQQVADEQQIDLIAVTSSRGRAPESGECLALQMLHDLDVALLVHPRAAIEVPDGQAVAGVA